MLLASSDSARGDEPGDSSGLVVKQKLVGTRTPEETVLELTVTNSGRTTFEAVTVRGPVPDGYKVSTAEPKAQREGNQLTWDLDALAPGATRTVKLKLASAKADAIPELRAQFRVTFRGEVPTALIAPAKFVGLAIEIEAPGEALVGKPATIKVKITNPGDVPARGVVLMATLPEGLTHAAGADLENPVGDIPPGETKTVPLKVTPTKPGEYSTRVRVIGAGGAKASEFRLVAKGKPEVTAKAPTDIAVRTLVELEFTARNDGAETIKGARIVARLPKGVAYVTATDGTYAPTTHVAEWDLGDLKPGDTRTVRLEIVARIDGELSVPVALQDADGIAVTSTTLPLPVKAEGRPR